MMYDMMPFKLIFKQFKGPKISQKNVNIIEC